MFRYVLPALLLATPLQADITVRFQDGNPKDLFTIVNTGCELAGAVMVIDLRGSRSGAVIDTEYGGVGTKDPLDVNVEAGDIRLPEIADGEQVLHIFIDLLPDGGEAVVSLDLDDTIDVRAEPRVEVWGSDIAGAEVSISLEGVTTSATMDETARAKVPTPPTAQGCLIA